MLKLKLIQPPEENTCRKYLHVYVDINLISECKKLAMKTGRNLNHTVEILLEYALKEVKIVE